MIHPNPLILKRPLHRTQSCISFAIPHAASRCSARRLNPPPSSSSYGWLSLIPPLLCMPLGRLLFSFFFLFLSIYSESGGLGPCPLVYVVGEPQPRSYEFLLVATVFAYSSSSRTSPNSFRSVLSLVVEIPLSNSLQGTSSVRLSTPLTKNGSRLSSISSLCKGFRQETKLP